MRIRMFSLCAERELAQRKLEAKIADSLHGFASNELEFEDFSSPQELLAPLAQSLKNEALTVVAVEKPSYNKLKKKLLGAMGYELNENAEIKLLVSQKEGLDEKKIASNSLFPSDARIFPSADGLFSGFCVTKGDKFFLMLPLDKNRIDAMLSNEVIPYLVSLFGEPTEEPAVPVVKKEKSSFSNPLVRSVNLLKEANSRVAFCANRQEPIIQTVLDSIDGTDDMFLFAPHVEDRGDIDVVSYSVQLARAAKNLSHTELGAVISDPFDDENGRGVCISITDGEKAIARRFYAEENESDESLITAATEETVTLLGQNAYGILSENAIGGTPDEIPEKLAEKKTVKTVLIILVIILVLCIGAGVAFKYLDSRKKAEETTTSSTEAPTPTITTTEPVEKVEEADLMAHIIPLMTGEEEHKVKKPETEPKTFLRNGEELDAKDALALIVQNSINDEDEWDEESLKAMAVVIYTNLLYRDNNFDISDVKLADTADAGVKQAVDAVFGDYLTFEDSVIAAPYHRYSAGNTASAQTVYGVDIPYLTSVAVDSDKRTDDYKYDVAITTSELNSIILKTTSQNLFEISTDPKTWIKILSHDKGFDGDTGYVESMSVATETFSGYDFVKLIEKNSKNRITSLCFDINYVDADKEFIFTCYGYGSGVGMSQRGAIRMAKRENATYDEILQYFYPDTELQLGSASQQEDEESTSGTTARSNSNSNSGSNNSGSSSNRTATTTARPSSTTERTTERTTEQSTTRATTEPTTDPTTQDEDQGLADFSENDD